MIALHFLHVVARIALKVQTPLRAKETVAQVARYTMKWKRTPDAEVVARQLDGHGTCLSRALTLAVCLPGSEVVIAVDPALATPLYAHAWVEWKGLPLRKSDVRGHEIARIR